MTFRTDFDRARAVALALTAVVSCARCGDASTEGTGTVSMSLAPLVQSGLVRRAVFDLRIDVVGADGIATPHLMLEDLVAGPSGVLTFVGTCRSGDGGADALGVATATLQSIELADGSGEANAQLPMTQVKPFVCRHGGDTGIDFVFEVVLGLPRGFTDLRVEIERLECAAKRDCVDAFLPNADGTHGPTLITGLSCKGGGEGALDNLVSMTRRIRCFDADGTPLPESTAPAITTERSYTGLELAGDGTGSGAAYWNTATLFDETAFAGAEHCRFEAFAFVRSQAAEGTRQAWVRVGAKALRWDVELRLEGGSLVCDGEVDVVTVGLRIEGAPEPADAERSARVAPVTLDTTIVMDGALRGAQTTGALSVWAARVTFPMHPLDATATPVQDEALWVGDPTLGALETTFVSACAPGPDRVWLVVGLADPAQPATTRRGAIQLLRTAEGDWKCSAWPDGGCVEYALSEVACTPEPP